MKHKQFFKNNLWVLIALAISVSSLKGQELPMKKDLAANQKDFLDLRFGMFIHYNMATYVGEDWADPDAPLSVFNPKKLDTDQWADAALSANMTYGCLTTKHHNGFPLWDTKTSSYNVMNSPLKRDVVKEFSDSFREKGLKVMLYYSIMDIHENLRPGKITGDHVTLVKDQLTELFTNYGEISAIFIDGWDAPWSRISYDDIPFEEVYNLIKSLQPNCLIMELNAAKYPSEALFYTDIKSYEQGAGQHISKEANRLPSLSCLPLQSHWFWKESFPTTAVKDPSFLVNENLIPFNKSFCNFILNVGPNRDGLIDDNALEALKEIGRLYQTPTELPLFTGVESPIIARNLAKKKPMNGSWSQDYAIMDYANDDNYRSSWNSNSSVKDPWLEVDLQKEEGFNAIVITENGHNIKSYTVEYRLNNKWNTLFESTNTDKVKIHRFEKKYGDKIRVRFNDFDSPPSISEIGVYHERQNQ